jgi:hypothetical protein
MTVPEGSVILPREGCPPKLMNQARRALIREVKKGPKKLHSGDWSICP